MLHLLRDIRFRSIMLVSLVVWAILAAVWYLTLGWDPAPVVRPLTRGSGAVAAVPDRTAESSPAAVEAAAVPEPEVIPAGISPTPQPPAEPSPAHPSRPVAASGGFELQAGAFQHETGARARMRELEARGHPVRIEPAPAEGLIRVLVGPFPTQVEARRVQRILEADGIGSFVRQESGGR
jgi:cell division protein FtsN